MAPDPGGDGHRAPAREDRAHRGWRSVLDASGELVEAAEALLAEPRKLSIAPLEDALRVGLGDLSWGQAGRQLLPRRVDTARRDVREAGGGNVGIAVTEDAGSADDPELLAVA